MATTSEKPTAMADTTQEVPNVSQEPDGTFVRPKGWMYKSIKIGPLTLPWYASPKTQLFLVALVCFLCPGMFNAVNGLGAGGQVDAKPADDALTALYATFSVVGFFAGTFANKLGIRLTLSFGGFGYGLYVAALLCYNHTKNAGFLIFSGALLGVCAGLLWTAQGAIMMSYPLEASKGRFISWFWMIFNLGGVLGSLIPLGQNINVVNNSVVSDGTYIGFIVLMFLGAIFALCLCDAGKVIREDGSRVVLMKNPTWKTELVGLYETLIHDSYIIFLFPMFFASNWFYTYQFNGMNGAHFNTRTRALNNTLYWLSQIIGAFVFGFALDIGSLRRTTRAKGALAALFTITMVIWGGGYAWQSKQDERWITSADGYVGVDFADSGYVGPMFLYMFYGFYDAAWQTCVYWFMGALSNSSRKTANFAGFYKGIQSAGAAIFWAIDSKKVSYMSEFASSWALLAGALVIASPVIFVKIKDHVSVEEDLAFSDETLADVLPAGHAEKQIEA